MAKWPTCAVCGKPFRREPAAPHKLYCSPRHARTAEARRWRERRAEAATRRRAEVRDDAATDGPPVTWEIVWKCGHAHEDYAAAAQCAAAELANRIGEAQP